MPNKLSQTLQQLTKSGNLRLKKTILATANDNLAKALDAKVAQEKPSTSTSCKQAHVTLKKPLTRLSLKPKTLTRPYDAKVALETAQRQTSRIGTNLQNAKYTLSMMQDHERAKTQLVNARQDLTVAQKGLR